MAMVNGSVTAAWTYARQLAAATGDPEFWLEVGQAFEVTFGRAE
jgi:hypothetical protein